MLKLHLHGSFRASLESGRDATPTAAKAQGLLALLATAPRGERGRVWLQSKLWSDRGPEQAAASLRQSLVQIRRKLGPASDVLDASRQRVRLDLSRVEVLRAEGEELLEGLDVRDQEFERWLIDARMRAHAVPGAPAPGARPWGISVSARRSGSGEFAWMAQLFADRMAQSIREVFSAEVLVTDPAAAAPRHWSVFAEMHPLTGGGVGVRVSLEHPASGRQAWSGARALRLRGAPPLDDPELMALGNQLIEAVGDTLLAEAGPGAEDPDVLCRRAIRRVFEMRPDSIRSADALFARAFEMRPRGLYLAWRAQIRAIQRVEKHEPDERLLREGGAEFCARALEIEPNNSMVLATVANTHGHLLRDVERPLSLARRSVMLNPANPMAWWALSSANVYSGNVEASYQQAVAGRALALTSPHRFWWDNQIFGAALTAGRLGEAKRHAEACLSQNAEFRPPLRYLIALYANDGDEEKAVAAAARLKALEPDFSVERLIRDAAYPASLIHRTPALDIGRLAAIA